MNYRLFEQHAAAYLREKDHEILYEDYRKSRTQIDVVARKGSTLVVIEVKYRKNGGLPEELISHGQMQRILREVGPLMGQHNCSDWQFLLFFYCAKSFHPDIITIEC